MSALVLPGLKADLGLQDVSICWIAPAEKNEPCDLRHPEPISGLAVPGENTVYVRRGLGWPTVAETLAHELRHIWQAKNDRWGAHVSDREQDARWYAESFAKSFVMEAA